MSNNKPDGLIAAPNSVLQRGHSLLAHSAMSNQPTLDKLVSRITLGRFLALRALKSRPHTMLELAGIAGVSPAAMTGMRDALKQDGLIEDACGKDRRVVMVSITTRGLEVVADFEDTVRTGIA